MNHPPDPKRELERFWSASRSYYEQAAASNREAAPERRRLLARLAGGERLLDLGCGSCENAQWVPPGGPYVGYDVALAGLRLADELGRPGLRVRGGGERLPFRDGAFDAVLSTYALEHFHDPGATLAEAARVLRPGGLLLLVASAWDLPYEIPPSIAPNRRWTVAARRTLRQVRWLLGGRFYFEIVTRPRVLTSGYQPDTDAVHVAQSHLLRRFLEATGFEIEQQAVLPHAVDPDGPRGWLRRLLRRARLWHHGWGNLLLVARRGPRVSLPPYRLSPL